MCELAKISSFPEPHDQNRVSVELLTKCPALPVDEVKVYPFACGARVFDCILSDTTQKSKAVAPDPARLAAVLRLMSYVSTKPKRPWVRPHIASKVRPACRLCDMATAQELR